MTDKRKVLNWRFDVNTFRLLGRELITDRITAVYELVKNCYDANATSVTITFNNLSTSSSNGKITISDNGTGMSFDDVNDKWMVVGTASKRINLFSPAPFKRRYVGEKGIGRFAVDKLGDKVRISTTEKGATQKLVVDIDWKQYDKPSSAKQIELFTDIDNYYHYEKSEPGEHGTTLSIGDVNEVWTELDILRLERELEKIVSPFYPLKPEFNIFLHSSDHNKYSNKPVKANPIKYFSHHYTLKYDTKTKTQETLKWIKAKGEIVKVKTPPKSFGPVSLELYYFNEAAKKKYGAAYKNDDTRIDGIKIYRDKLITTPFAEYESQADKKRDILGIDKRTWSSAFDRIGTREIIGILDITNKGNPGIRDSTNRQDFNENKEYRELKDFIVEQLKVLEEYKKHVRDKGKTETTVALEQAGTDVRDFAQKISKLGVKKPELQKLLTPLQRQAKEINRSIAKGIKQQKRERQEYTRKENIYLSLMSLQEYAVHISHAVRTSLGKVKRVAEFFKNEFPNAKHEKLFKEYAIQIYDEMQNLNRVIDFMLSYAGSNVDFKDLNINDLLEVLINKSYDRVFQAEKITTIIEIKDDFILNANKQFFEDIIQNLISNSIKALKDEENKIIKCSGYIDKDSFVLTFSDNGCGIKKADKQKVFDIYYTTTADEGGAGIGLYVVKTRVESLNGSISIIQSEFKPKGVTFRMVFPFKKQE